MESNSVVSYVCKVMSYSYQSKKWEFVGDRKESSRVEIVKKPSDNFHRIVGFRESDKIETIDMEINKKLVINLSVKTFVTLKGEQSTFGIQFKKEKESSDFLNKVTAIKSAIGSEPPTLPPSIDDDSNRRNSPPSAQPMAPPNAPPNIPNQKYSSVGSAGKSPVPPQKSGFISIKKNVGDGAPDSTDNSSGNQAYSEASADFGSAAPPPPPPPPPAAAPPPLTSSNDTHSPAESGGDSLSSALAGIKLRKTTPATNAATSLYVKSTGQNNVVEKPTITPAQAIGGADMMSEMQMKLLKRKNKENAETEAAAQAEGQSLGSNSANPPAPTINIKTQNPSSPITRHQPINTFSLRAPPKVAAVDSNNNKMDSDSKSNLSPEMFNLKEEIMRDVRKELEIMKKEILEALNK